MASAASGSVENATAGGAENKVTPGAHALNQTERKGNPASLARRSLDPAHRQPTLGTAELLVLGEGRGGDLSREATAFAYGLVELSLHRGSSAQELLVALRDGSGDAIQLGLGSGQVSLGLFDRIEELQLLVFQPAPLGLTLFQLALEAFEFFRVPNRAGVEPLFILLDAGADLGDRPFELPRALLLLAEMVAQARDRGPR